VNRYHFERAAAAIFTTIIRFTASMACGVSKRRPVIVGPKGGARQSRSGG